MSRLNEIKEATAKLLGVKVEDVNYITDDLLKEYQKPSQVPQQLGGTADGSKAPAGEATLVERWGVYGNSITYDPGNDPYGLVYWKQGPKGTPNYGCGTSESWHAGKRDWASNIVEQGTCAGGLRWFFIGNYNP